MVGESVPTDNSGRAYLQARQEVATKAPADYNRQVPPALPRVCVQA